VIRILIVDDHEVVREGLRAILQTDPEVELVGEAADGGEAVRLAAELKPDIVLMDLSMPEVGGIEAIEQIKALALPLEIVILTTYADDELIVRGLRAGARGYLLKDAGRKALFESIRAAHRGELLLPSSVAERVMTHLEKPQAPQYQQLSARELEVLTLMSDGAANKQIAGRLEIAERTVKAHISSIFMKLEVGSRAEAVAVALRKGLLPGDRPF
jgi:NarL family two-component system response regulator YdfI